MRYITFVCMYLKGNSIFAGEINSFLRRPTQQSLSVAWNLAKEMGTDDYYKRNKHF